ncbi:MAG TPA: GAF domain-containing sensor histidine kinase [Candidatus Limnocylindria bacterium]|nr:GAF domain-containing sensor histidine kinase [Candidatus Limnocylindria bacterium]
MTCFAALAQADALAIVLRPDRDFVTYAAHNVPAGAGWSAAAFEGLLSDAPAVDTDAAFPLADGRSATRLHALPVTWDGRRIAVFAGLRVSGDFTRNDCAILDGIAALVAIDLAEQLAASRQLRAATDREAGAVAARERAEDDRQQAITLFELSRLASHGKDMQQAFETAVELLAGSMRHDAVGVWVAAGDGMLRLRAARGYGEILPGEIPVVAEGDDLALALRERRALRSGEPSAAARPAWLPAGMKAYVIVPIASPEDTAGALVLGRRDTTCADSDVDFAEIAGEYFADLLHREADAAAAERAAAVERKRIAQEIHDSLAQELTGIVLSLEGAQRALQRSPQAGGQLLTRAIRESRSALADVRQYMGALRDADPAALGLPASVVKLVDDARGRSGLAIELVEQGERCDLGPGLDRVVMRIMSEALRNVAAHANATHAMVLLRYDASSVVVTIEDDGAGFDVEQTSAVARSAGHYGLVGMRERAEAVGGQFDVRSASGGGTTVAVTIPYEFADAATSADVLPEPTTVAPAPVRFFAKLFGR